MAFRIFGRVLPLAERRVVRRFDDACAGSLRAIVVSVHVVHCHVDVLLHFARPRRAVFGAPAERPAEVAAALASEPTRTVPTAPAGEPPTVWVPALVGAAA